nr:phosphoglycerate dehydrogenase [uncultured Massilia sp.]
MEDPVRRPRRRVVITQRHIDATTLAYLDEHGCDVHLADLPPGQADGELGEDRLRGLLADADGWIVGHARVSASLLQQLPGLQVIARRGVGYDRVDTAAVARLGKVATIASGGNDACVADHALAMMLALGHRLRESQRNMEQGDWTILAGTDLYRKTVGIVGFGRIGQAVARRLSGFDADVLVACSGAAAGPHGPAVRHVDLDTLLAQSDYVTLHAPLTPATRCMIDTRALARMRRGAFLINTARGGLVDDRALLHALREGRLAGAGLDVFASEADPAYADATAALLALPNVVCTPHAAASTREGLQRTNMIAARCVVAVLDGGSPPSACLIADGRNT